LPELASKHPVDLASPVSEEGASNENPKTPATLIAQAAGLGNPPSGEALADAQGKSSSEEGCVFSSDGPELSPTVAYKPGNYVYLVGLNDTVVCLKDGQNKVSRVPLLAGAAQTVLGDSPWRVTFKSSQDAKIFYQGQKIQLPEANNQTIKLLEFRP
jgi:hypothetical protein